MEARNYYELLQVERPVEVLSIEQEIRFVQSVTLNFRRLLRVFHPDANGSKTRADTSENIRDLKEAKDTLVDVARRNVYNRRLDKLGIPIAWVFRARRFEYHFKANTTEGLEVVKLMAHDNALKKFPDFVKQIIEGSDIGSPYGAETLLFVARSGMVPTMRENYDLLVQKLRFFDDYYLECDQQKYSFQILDIILRKKFIDAKFGFEILGKLNPLDDRHATYIIKMINMGLFDESIPALKRFMSNVDESRMCTLRIRTAIKHRELPNTGLHSDAVEMTRDAYAYREVRVSGSGKKFDEWFETYIPTLNRFWGQRLENLEVSEENRPMLILLRDDVVRELFVDNIRVFAKGYFRISRHHKDKDPNSILEVFSETFLREMLDDYLNQQKLLSTIGRQEYDDAPYVKLNTLLIKGSFEDLQDVVERYSSHPYFNRVNLLTVMRTAGINLEVMGDRIWDFDNFREMYPQIPEGILITQRFGNLADQKMKRLVEFAEKIYERCGTSQRMSYWCAYKLMKHNHRLPEFWEPLVYEQMRKYRDYLDFYSRKSLDALDGTDRDMHGRVAGQDYATAHINVASASKEVDDIFGKANLPDNYQEGVLLYFEGNFEDACATLKCNIEELEPLVDTIVAGMRNVALSNLEM